MIEQMQVLRCDVTTVFLAQNQHRHRGQCDRTFPAAQGLAEAWPHAVRHGWSEDDCAGIDGKPRHRCPHHTRMAAAGAKQIWWDLRARARSAEGAGQ